MIRKALGEHLFGLRSAKELTMAVVAEELGWSLSKLLRIENGQIGVSRTDLRALLAFYEVTDQALTARLIEWQSAGRRLDLNKRAGLDRTVADYYEYESEATVIRIYAPIGVPGLLATADYVTALLTGQAWESTPPDKVQAAIEANIRRGEIVCRPQPPLVQVAIDEGAMMRPAGNQTLMAELYDHLDRITAASPMIQVRVMRFCDGAYPGLMDPTFSLLVFEDETERVFQRDWYDEPAPRLRVGVLARQKWTWEHLWAVGTDYADWRKPGVAAELIDWPSRVRDLSL